MVADTKVRNRIGQPNSGEARIIRFLGLVKNWP